MNFKRTMRFGCGAMALVFVALLGACGDGETPSSSPLKELSAAPSYTQEHTMRIGIWEAPAASETSFRYMLDAGVNMVWNVDSADYFRLADLNGIKVYPNLARNFGNSLKQLSTLEQTNQKWELYKDHPSFGGFNYVDEPGCDNIADLPPLAENHNQNFKDREFVVNLYPSSFYYQHAKNIYNSYEEYVEDFCENALVNLPDTTRLLSFDHYNIKRATKNGETVAALSDNWLYTAEVIAHYAKEYDADTHAFLLTCEHYDYLPQTYESLRWQAYTYMAYGIRGFSHFTYSGGGFLIDPPVDVGTGVPKNVPLYEAVKRLDNELLAWDDIYLSFNWDNVLQVLGSDNLAEDDDYSNLLFDYTSMAAESSPYISSVTATKDTLVGLFRDGDGNPGFMVTNMDFPTAVMPEGSEVPGAPDFETLGVDEVRIKVDGANRAIVIREGSVSEMNVQEGTIRLSLAPSEGVFVIPYRVKK